MNQKERTALSAGYRVLTTTGEEQDRALQRLSAIAGEDVAFEAWLLTKPDPELVKKVLDAQMKEALRRYSPFRSMQVMPVTISTFGGQQ